MNKYLRYEKAKASAVYKTVAIAAVDALTTIGVFNKDKVLISTGLDVLGDECVRWDYIRLMIEEEYGTELYPVSEAFFKRGAKKEAEYFPGRFIAMGNGKRTAGYVIASPENRHFVINRLEVRRAIVKGTTEAADRTLKIGQKVGAIPIGDLPTSQSHEVA